MHSETSLDYHYTMCEKYGHVARLRGGMFGVSFASVIIIGNTSDAYNNSFKLMVSTSLIRPPSTTFSFVINITSVNLWNSLGQILYDLVNLAINKLIALFSVFGVINGGDILSCVHGWLSITSTDSYYLMPDQVPNTRNSVV